MAGKTDRMVRGCDSLKQEHLCQYVGTAAFSDGNNVTSGPKLKRLLQKDTSIYSAATIADQIMRGAKRSSEGVLQGLTDCVFCCVCIRKGLEGSQGSSKCSK